MMPEFAWRAAQPDGQLVEGRTEAAASEAVLRQLNPAQLAQLALVAQRTPPQERDTVRSAFLAVPAADANGMIILGERLTGMQYLASLMVLGGVIVSQRR